jgi:hypothetical protein
MSATGLAEAVAAPFERIGAAVGSAVEKISRQ